MPVDSQQVVCAGSGLLHFYVVMDARIAYGTGITCVCSLFRQPKETLPMAAKTTAPTVTLKHLSANVAEGHELSKKQAEAILGNMVELVVKHLKKGDSIRIGGLGIP